ncbi:MAG: UDP-N-acetylglucosamine 2-epimerase (hydrolyzing) [Proteobacteria bacterium]|nr:UDP-N-acetylglucosamine 2-epimerase (hydrolyzing) [Pseudomonadota bacterium]MBU4384640.1 UDP-N-acetylglucosamine 2-epimerase (hydrolyzing) [Pseudomonadota bacterium]MCG2766212.1 UDP-N-acetylglucosamine 2-epimerase [Desulfarculaceae bacterium]
MKRKICVLVTARPSYSRIKTALKAIQEHPDLELQLVVAGSALLDRYGQVVKLIEKDGFEIARKVYIIMEGENLVTSAKSTGIAVVELTTVFDHLKPDAVVSVADRFETLATAVSAAYMNIPLAHVQGGEVTGSIDEKVRHAVTKLADLHFVANQMAAERVIRMGEEPATVFVTGCPSVDLAARVARDRALDFDPTEKYGGVGAEVDISKGYLVVMQHPVTTEHNLAREHINQTLAAVKASGLQALWFWPNVDAGSDGTSKGLRSFRENNGGIPIRFFKNMYSEDFLRLLCNCRCLVGNSSVGIRECSYLGVPAVNIGSRQVGRQRGANVTDVPYDKDAILAAIHENHANGHCPCETIYGDGNAGKSIADLLAKVELTITKRLTY